MDARPSGVIRWRSAEVTSSRLRSRTRPQPRNLKMAFESGEQRLPEKRTSRQQAGQEWIPVIAAQRSIFQRGDKSAGAFHQGRARCNVPLVLWGQREGDIGESCCDEAQFISDRTHWPNLKITILKLFPFAALHLAAAGQDQRTLQDRPLAWVGRFAVIEDSGFDRADDRFFRRRI